MSSRAASEPFSAAASSPPGTHRSALNSAGASHHGSPSRGSTHGSSAGLPPQPQTSPQTTTPASRGGSGGGDAAAAGPWPTSASSPQRPRRAPAPTSAAAAATAGPLNVDPRSGLPLIDIPREQVHAFSHLGQDMVLHLWLTIQRISSRGKSLKRVLFVTDHTLFLCEPTGAVQRCVPVSSINQINVAADNSNAIALTIPAEYDIIVVFDRRQERDDTLVVLRAVYRRMTDAELPLRQVRDIRANQYRMDKPPGFQLQRIPQRTREHLRKALQTIEQQEQERHEAAEGVQGELEATHRVEREAKLKEAVAVRAKLDEAESRLRRQHDEIESLRFEYGRTKARVDEIEGQMRTGEGGSAGSAVDAKDQRIRELNDAVERLQAAQAQVNSERNTIAKMKREGDFLRVELPPSRSRVHGFDNDGGNGLTASPYGSPIRAVSNGRAVHEQAVVEVLQRQLAAKEQELAQLQGKARDIALLKRQLQQKEDAIRQLELQTGGRRIDGASSPHRHEDSTFSPSPRRQHHSDPSGGGFETYRPESVVRDEDGEEAHTGAWPTLSPSRALDPAAVAADVAYRVPDRLAEFTKDPRTGLEFIAVPHYLDKDFSDLQGTVLFFFGLGMKMNKRGRTQRRVIVCSDRSLYIANLSGHVTRCVWVSAVKELCIDGRGMVGLKIKGKSEYDVVVAFDEPNMAEALCAVLQRIGGFLRLTPPIAVNRQHELHIADYVLEKPPTFEFRIHPLTPKSKLHAVLRELAKASVAERHALDDARDAETARIVNDMKQEMRAEVNMRREREFALLRQQIALVDASVREKDGEVRELRASIAKHNCAEVASPARLAASRRDAALTQVARDDDGVATDAAIGAGFFVPTDPVVMQGTFDVLCLRFAGDLVVSGHANGLVCVWDLTSARVVRTFRNGHTARVEAIDFDGHTIISGGFDGAIRRWDFATSECERNLQGAHRGHVRQLRFDPLHLISAGSDALIHVWDAQSFLHEKTLTGHKSPVTGLSLQRNALVSCEWGWIFVWDLDRGVIAKALRDELGGIATIDVRGTAILSGGSGGRLVVWSADTGESEVLEGHQDDVTQVQLAANGFAVSASLDGTVRTWDTSRRRHLGVFTNAHPDEPRTFHMHANRIVVGQGRTIKAWTRG